MSLPKGSTRHRLPLWQGVKTFLNWVEDEEYLEVSSIARLKLGTPHYRDVEPHSDEEVPRLVFSLQVSAYSERLAEKAEEVEQWPVR